MNRTLFIMGLVCILLLSGCGLLTDEGDKDAKEEEKKTTGVQAAKETAQQPWFEDAYWDDMSEDFPRRSSGGIWYYTEEKHPGNIDDIFEWDEVDVLHIQLSDKEYYGYVIYPIGVELLEDDVVKVVLKLKKGKTHGTSDAEAARVLIEVKKGELEGKKFSVETEDGERLNTN